MILTVAAFGMMQVAVDQVIDMITMRHGLVAATGSVLMALFMAATIVVRNCGCGVSGVDGNHVLVHVPLMKMVQVPVMEIVRVSLVLNRGMSASRAMLMRVGVMRLTLLILSHGSLLPKVESVRALSGHPLIRDGMAMENDVQLEKA
jgi:hypothetical protein